MNLIRQITNLIRAPCCTVKLISHYWATRPRFLSTPPFTGSSLSPLNLLHSSSPHLSQPLLFPIPPLPPLHVTVSCFCSAQKQKPPTLVCKKVAAGDKRKRRLRWVSRAPWAHNDKLPRLQPNTDILSAIHSSLIYDTLRIKREMVVRKTPPWLGK